MYLIVIVFTITYKTGIPSSLLVVTIVAKVLVFFSNYLIKRQADVSKPTHRDKISKIAILVKYYKRAHKIGRLFRIF